jgi:hypothetical protein
MTFCLARLGPARDINFDFFNSVSSVFSSFFITLLKSTKVSAQHCLKKWPVRIKSDRAGQDGIWEGDIDGSNLDRESVRMIRG